MHTFFITSGSRESRLEYIQKACENLGIHPYDMHRLIPKPPSLSIGVSDVRIWQKKLSLMPLASPYTIGILPNAELLTIEAQNALLKTFEEPPLHTRIYLVSQGSATLLPTILSRCQVIHLTNDVTEHGELNQKIITIILQLCDENISIGNKMALLDTEITNKEDAKTWITEAIYSIRIIRDTLPTPIYISFVQRLLSSSEYLASNVSYKLAIDHLILPKIH